MSGQQIYMEESIERSGDRIRLVGARCTSCGSVFFPARKRCTHCFSHELERHALSPTGKIYSFSVVHAASPAFNPPYVVAYVDFPENVRVFGKLEIPPEKFGEVKIGDTVEATLGVIRRENNEDVYGYKFLPCGSSQSEGV